MKVLSVRTWLIVAGVFVVVLAGSAALVAGAAGGSKVSSSAATTTTKPNNSRARHCDKFVGHLAGDLGKSQSDVKSAISKAIDQTIADAVSNHDLTQDQANKIKQHLSQNGGFCQGFGRFGHHFGPGGKFGSGFFGFGLDAAASALKITPAELKQDIANGMTLHQIADSKGVTEDQFKAALKTSLSQKLDQAVQQGKITKDQETRLLARVDESVNNFWDKSLAHHKAP